MDQHTEYRQKILTGFIQYVVRANDEVRLWSLSTGTCVGLRNTKFVVIYHTTLVSPPTHLINTTKKLCSDHF